MAAPSYTTDLLTYNDMTSTTGWSEATGMTQTDGSGVVDTDLGILGNSCLSESQRKSGLGSLVYTGTAPTLPVGGAFFIWQKFFAPNSLDIESNGGIRMLVGSTSANYYGYYYRGSDTYDYGGWLNLVVDPSQSGSASQTQGTPAVGVFNTVGCGWNLINGISKGNSMTIDILRYGRGILGMSDGDLANGYATFTGAAAVNDNATTGRWGLLQFVQGRTYLHKGLLSLGTGSLAVDFRDSNKNIQIDDTPFVNSDFNRIECRVATSNIEWNSINYSALGTQAKGNFEMIDNCAVTQSDCTFIDMGTFKYQSNANVQGTTFRRCEEVFQGGATFYGCTFDQASGSVAITGSNPSLVTGSTFISDGTGHAYELNTTGTYLWNDNAVEGYATIDGSTGNEVFYNNSGGAVTLNKVGGTGTVSIRNGTGASTTLNVTSTTTLTGLKDFTEIRVLQAGTNTELAGIENVVSASVGANDNEFAFTLTVGTDTTIVVHSLQYEYLAINFTIPANNAEVPVQQRFDRNYSNP